MTEELLGGVVGVAEAVGLRIEHEGGPPGRAPSNARRGRAWAAARGSARRLDEGLRHAAGDARPSRGLGEDGAVRRNPADAGRDQRVVEAVEQGELTASGEVGSAVHGGAELGRAVQPARIPGEVLAGEAGAGVLAEMDKRMAA